MNRILPQQIDNTYRGHKLALWLFGLIIVVRVFQSLTILFSDTSTVVYADGIPLNTYTPAGAQAVMALFALTGISTLVIYLLSILVLVRYRSAVSFMLAVLALDYLARQLLNHFIPLVRTGTPPGPIVNLVLFVLMIAGLLLSLWRKPAPGE